MKKKYQSTEHSIATQENVRAIMSNIATSAMSAIDVGCNEALVSCALDNMGIKVEAYEANPSYAATAAEFIARNKQRNIVLHNKNIEIGDLIKMEPPDVALLLSVHHQIVQYRGIAYANNFLCELYKKVNQQLFFQPALIYPKYHCEMPFPENDILGCFEYFSNLLRSCEEEVNAEIINITHNFMPPQEPYRPLFVFSKSNFEKGKRVPTMEAYADCPDQQHSHLVCVNINNAVTCSSLQSFSPKKWHYMSEACREILAGKTNEESILHRYYRKVLPKKLGDIYTQAGIADDVGILHEWAIHKAPVPFVFRENPPDLNISLISPEKNHAFGPQPEKNINYHLDLLRECTTTIKKDGYSPELHIDGYVCGVILKKGNECRFCVLSGQHRLAVLSNLNYTHFVAKLYPGFMDVLEFEDVQQWPMVSNGVYTKDQALTIFNAIFDADGEWSRKLCC